MGQLWGLRVHLRPAIPFWKCYIYNRWRICTSTRACICPCKKICEGEIWDCTTGLKDLEARSSARTRAVDFEACGGLPRCYNGRPGERVSLLWRNLSIAGWEKLTLSWSSRIRLYEKLSELVPPELQDPMDPPNPSKDSSLVSASPKELPHYHALWEQDERRATDFLVKWFAGWACTQATKYRRFVVVHPMNKPEWTDRYNHILDVATPEECIRLYLEPKNKK